MHDVGMPTILRPFVLALALSGGALSGGVFTGGVLIGGEAERIATVAKTKGLIAFWDFILTKDGTWTSHYDPKVIDRGYPVVLRQILDSALRPG